MSQNEHPAGSQPPSSDQQPPASYSAPQPGYQPAPSGYHPGASPVGHAPVPQQLGNQPAPPDAPKQRNTIGLIALIIAILGFIFACIPGAAIVGWVLLPIAFILAIVSFFQRGKGKGFGIAALIVSVVGTIVGAIVFFSVVVASVNDALSTETTAITPTEAAPAAEDGAASEPATAPDAAAEEGTRESPLPLGSTISSDEWTVTIDSYNAAGDEAVAAANQFNEPAPAGSHYEIVTYSVTYTGEESSYALMVGVDLVTSSGNVIDTTESLVTLEDSMGLDELFNGASTTGSTAFLVPDDESVLLRVRPGMLAEEVFVQP